MLNWIARCCGYVRRDAEIRRLEADVQRLQDELTAKTLEAELSTELLAFYRKRVERALESMGADAATIKLEKRA